jgi:hypothetical protein
VLSILFSSTIGRVSVFKLGFEVGLEPPPPNSFSLLEIPVPGIPVLR